MMTLTNVTFGLWCFGATNAWLKNGYLWIENDIFDQKSLNLKKVILEKNYIQPCFADYFLGSILYWQKLRTRKDH